MSNTNGIVRFCLFIAIVVVVGLGYYSHTLSAKVAADDGALASVTADRDNWKAKYDGVQHTAADTATALQTAQAQVKDLQAQLDAAKEAAAAPKPKAKARTR